MAIQEAVTISQGTGTQRATRLREALQLFVESRYGLVGVVLLALVVLVAVFLFGLFFFVVDLIFRYGIDQLLHRMGGWQ